MKPIKADFDNATKQTWNSKTCVMAQMLIRNKHSLDGGVSTNPIVYRNPHNMDVMENFDTYFEKVGDETKPELVALRASLPNNE